VGGLKQNHRLQKIDCAREMLLRVARIVCIDMTLNWILRKRRPYMIGNRGSRALRILQALTADRRAPKHVLVMRAVANRLVFSPIPALARVAVPRLRNRG
jgi:hypothetical protein